VITNLTLVEGLCAIIYTGCGTLRTFEWFVNKKLDEDPSLFLGSPLLIYATGTLCAKKHYKHLDTWRHKLTKFGWSFTPQDRAECCDTCLGTGILPGRSGDFCWHCNGTKTVRRSGFEARYNGEVINRAWAEQHL
jgi:hypothetical protein